MRRKLNEFIAALLSCGSTVRGRRASWLVFANYRNLEPEIQIIQFE
jgi:hypothetical protein